MHRAPPSTRCAAAAEGLGSLCAAVLCSGAAKSAVLGLPLPPALQEHAACAAQAAGVLGVLLLAYGPRFYSRGPWLSSCSSVAAALWRSLTQRGLLSLEGGLLLCFHAATVAALALQLGSVPTLFSCATATQLLYAPLLEELLFRVLIFYVCLHRTGGDALFAGAASSAIFAAIHSPNVLSAAPGSSGYVALQVAAAAACGATFTALFAARGSLLELLLLHCANNVAATAWQRWGSAGGGWGPCSPAAFELPAVQLRPLAAAVLMLQLCLYAAAGARAASRLGRALSTQEGTALFRAHHAVVYDAQGEEEGERGEGGEEEEGKSFYSAHFY